MLIFVDNFHEIEFQNKETQKDRNAGIMEY